jgi:nicotinamidase-related amidase
LHALILIDFQNDYFKNGKMELEYSNQAVLQAQKALKYFRTTNSPIIHVQHLETNLKAAFLANNTIGAEIHKSVKPLNNEAIISKHFPNAFRETNLLTILQEKNIKKLTICGMMTHMCVDATTRAAFDLGFKCSVLYDACATRALTFRNHKVSALDVQDASLAALSAPFAKMLSVKQFVK